MEASITARLNTMLIGREEVQIDERGRVVLSKKKRERLGNPFFLGLSQLGCIEAYPEEELVRVVMEIEQADRLNIGREAYGSFFSQNIFDDQKTDSQGRLVIPQRLRDLAKIQKDVVIVGSINKIQIWAKEEHEKFEADPLNYNRDYRAPIEQMYKIMRGQD
ncbi:MAG: hypothetical protein KDC26_05675 [Armatimonadetes bacterium]|nr:hypothetical protein [Armatimonadota bacterium]